MSNEDFSVRLAVALSKSGLSKRQLWLRLARERGITNDAAKSSVLKWFRQNSHEPNAENRAALSKILKRDLSEPDPLVDVLDSIKARLTRMDDAIDGQLGQQTDLLAKLGVLAVRIEEAVSLLANVAERLDPSEEERDPTEEQRRPA